MSEFREKIEKLVVEDKGDAEFLHLFLEEVYTPEEAVDFCRQMNMFIPYADERLVATASNAGNPNWAMIVQSLVTHKIKPDPYLYLERHDLVNLLKKFDERMVGQSKPDVFTPTMAENFLDKKGHAGYKRFKAAKNAK